MALEHRMKKGKHVNKRVFGISTLVVFPILVLLPSVQNLSMDYTTTDSDGTTAVNTVYFPVKDYGFIEDKYVIVSIQAGHNAYLQFFDDSLSVCGGKGLSVQIGIALDSWTKVECDFAYNKINMGVLNNNTFNTFWMTFDNGTIKLGQGRQLNTDNLVDIQYGSVHLITSLKIGTGHFGKVLWKFFIPTKKTGLSSVIFKDVNVTSGIVWHKQSIMAEDCALYCYLDSVCLAYSYNKNNKECQGHDEVYFNIENATSTNVQGVKYFAFLLVKSKNVH